MSYGLWPAMSELKKLVDVDPLDTNWDETLNRQMDAAIELVKREVGEWDDLLDVPDDQLAGASLRAAYLLSLKESPVQIIRDQVFATYMHGHHRRFAIS